MMQWIVSQAESGTPLHSFLRLKLGSTTSAKQIKRALDHNLCQVNGRTERFASYTLAFGDQIDLELDKTQSPAHSLFDPQRLLFEDDALLFYDKPAGTISDDEKFLSALQRKLPYLALAHRLDRETSGVLLLAKSEKMRTQLLTLFKKRLIDKQYLAVVDGHPRKSKGVIDNYLGALHRYQGQTLYGTVPASKGLHAVTEWVLEKTGEHAALVRCFPKTGRTHQIRVHLSEMGHPILGDYQYGRSFHCAYRPPRILLHAAALSVIHPLTQKPLTIESPLPQDFKDALRTLIGEK